MFGKKTDSRSKAPAERLSARQRREQREMRRRERLMLKQSRNAGLRERIIGCGFSGLIVGGVMFVLVLAGAMIYYYWFDR